MFEFTQPVVVWVCLHVSLKKRNQSGPDNVNRLRWLCMISADIRALWTPGVSVTVLKDGLHWSHSYLRQICQSYDDAVPGCSPVCGWFQVVLIFCKRCLDYKIVVRGTLKRLAPSAVFKLVLTHWGRGMHIWVSKLTIIVSYNGLSPGRRQAIIRTSARLLLIGPLGTNFSEIFIGFQIFSLKKMYLNMPSANWRPFCLYFNVLRILVALSLSMMVRSSKLILCWNEVSSNVQLTCDYKTFRGVV